MVEGDRSGGAQAKKMMDHPLGRHHPTTLDDVAIRKS